MSKIKNLSLELMQVLHRYKVRGVCIIVDDIDQDIHSASNMDADESLDLIKALAKNFTPCSKEVFDLEGHQPKIDLSDPNIN